MSLKTSPPGVTLGRRIFSWLGKIAATLGLVLLGLAALFCWLMACMAEDLQRRENASMKTELRMLKQQAPAASVPGIYWETTARCWEQDKAALYDRGSIVCLDVKEQPLPKGAA